MKYLNIVICVLVAVFVMACAKPPLEEMNNATAAVTRAENDADAVTYAANTLTRARDALNRMQTEADAKSYDAAKTYAAEAAAAAEKAISDGRTGAARAQEEANSLVTGLRSTVTETGEAIRSARSVANIQLDFNTIDRDFEAARRTADQAEVSLAGNNYADAIDKGRSARGLLSDITTRISGAATAVSRKK
jgi:alpha-D-ribose 1-methylphosphonate 5-triphosphate synthase subunit PhnH